MSSIVLGTGYAAVNKIDRTPCLYGHYILVDENVNKQNK